MSKSRVIISCSSKKASASLCAAGVNISISSVEIAAANLFFPMSSAIETAEKLREVVASRKSLVVSPGVSIVDDSERESG